MITADMVWVSPTLVSGITTQTTLQTSKIPFIGPHYLPKFAAKKLKATTKVTNEPPNMFISFCSGIKFKSGRCALKIYDYVHDELYDVDRSYI